MDVITNSEEETKKLVLSLLDIYPFKEHATIFVLQGELGSSKTTFVKGLENVLRVKIKSPTFNIIQKYKIDFRGFKNLYHIDFYRVADVLGLDFDEIVKNRENLVFIEWGENVKEHIPKYSKWIYFEYVDKHKRRIYEKDNHH